MTKRPLSTELKSNPTVRLTEKLGSRFIGKYIGSRDITISGKPNKLYELSALDGDALITVKEGNTYKEAAINEGAVVSLFGSKAIDTAMAQATPGQVLEFVFNGEKKLKGGRRFNDIAVAVLED